MFKRLFRTWQALTCPHPLPDGGPWMWWRCTYGCPWCDYIQKWWAVPCKSTHRPPYR